MARTRTRRTSRDGSFFARVYAFVAAIPPGCVVTYGQVARRLGVPSGARAVGWALRVLPEDLAQDVPWHRVLGAGGRISTRNGPGPLIQRRRLRLEGVRFVAGCVDLSRHALERAASTRRGTLAAGAAARGRGGR